MKKIYAKTVVKLYFMEKPLFSAKTQYDISGTYLAYGVETGGTCIERKNDGESIGNNPRTVIIHQAGESISISFEAAQEGHYIEFEGAILGREFNAETIASFNKKRKDCMAVEVQSLSGKIEEEGLSITRIAERNLNDGDPDCTIPPDPCTVIMDHTLEKVEN